LSWGPPAWSSENVQNSSISFTFLSGELSIQGYRICDYLQYHPINFQLEGKAKDGEWIEIDRRQDELTKTKFQNSSFSETSFECKKKGIFQSFRFTNLSPATNSTHSLHLYSIDFFGQFIQCFPKIIQKTQIKPNDPSDRLGALLYLHRKLSSSEFPSLVLASA
jgi:hypothetical protein